MAEQPKHLFVYGTLRPDDDSGAKWTHPFNHPEGYQVHAQFAFVEKAKMFFSECRYFHGFSPSFIDPVAILNDNGDDRIFGYILSVSNPEVNFPNFLQVADEIEAYPTGKSLEKACQ